MGFRTLSECLGNPDQNAFNRLIHIVVPEPDYPITFCLNPASAQCIHAGLLAMLSPIKLYDKPCRAA